MSTQPTKILKRQMAVLFAVLLAVTVFATSPAAAQDDPADVVPDQVVIFVIDLSGSMNEPFDGERTKLDVAKDAFVEAFTTITESGANVQVGIRVYGDQLAARPPGEREQNCLEDSRLVVPIGAPERESLIAEVQGFSATGDTAIGLALREASGDIPDGTLGTVVLFSDGRDECFDADLDGEAATGFSYGENPCEVAAEIAGDGVDLRIDRIETVGFAADAPAEVELRCIAEETGGNYTAIETPEDAREILPKVIGTFVSAREAQRLGGDAIIGTPTIDDAPDLQRLDAVDSGDGRYVDSIPMNGEKWYRIPEYGPGDGTFTATVFGLPAEEGITFESWLYLVADDQWFFEKSNENAGIPPQPTVSVRCPGCSISGGPHETYWVVYLYSENENLDGEYYMELLTEGPAFGGLSTSCQEPQECWYTQRLAQRTAALGELQVEYDSRLTSGVDPAKTAEREQLVEELGGAEAEAADRSARLADLEAQVAQLGGEKTSWTLPIVLALAGVAAAVGALVLGRRESTAPTTGGAEAPPPSSPPADPGDSGIVGHVVDDAVVDESPEGIESELPNVEHPAVRLRSNEGHDEVQPVAEDARADGDEVVDQRVPDVEPTAPEQDETPDVPGPPMGSNEPTRREDSSQPATQPDLEIPPDPGPDNEPSVAEIRAEQLEVPEADPASIQDTNEADANTDSAESTGQGVPSPGWYGDPDNAGQLRWWDGEAWTDHVRHDSEEGQ